MFVGNTIPTMDMSQGFQLALADDAANQLLTSVWSADGLDGMFDLKTGEYGSVGQLFDAVELEAKVPPFVDASTDHLILTVGDQPFLLTSRGGWAWCRGALQEEAIIAAARTAPSMRVEARDSAGRRFTDAEVFKDQLALCPGNGFIYIYIVCDLYVAILF